MGVSFTAPNSNAAHTDPIIRHREERPLKISQLPLITRATDKVNAEHAMPSSTTASPHRKTRNGSSISTTVTTPAMSVRRIMAAANRWLRKVAICKVEAFSMGILTSLLVLRHRQFIKNLLDDRLAGLLLRLRFVGDRHAVAEHIHADALDILRGDIAAPAQEGEGLGRERERNRRARRGAELNEIFRVDVVVRRVARGAHQIDDVILHLVVNVDVVDDFARGEDGFRI